jgi:hypothetical protein
MKQIDIAAVLYKGEALLSLMCQISFTPGRLPVFLLEAESTQWMEGLRQLKNAMTSGIKSATFWLEALCFNQLCYSLTPVSTIFCQ